MMRWITGLFSGKGLLGQRVHAWHWTEWGRAHVVGEVVEETEQSLVLDCSYPDSQQFSAFKTVWQHDARPVGEALPVDTTAQTHLIGT